MPAISTQARKNGPDAGLRQHQRERFASTVHLWQSSRHIIEGHSLDISVGGLLVVVPVNLSLQSRCAIRFFVPGAPQGVRQVLARAQVISNRFNGKESGFLIGLRFTTVAEPSLIAIRDYLHERLKSTLRPNRLRGYPPSTSMPAAR